MVHKITLHTRSISSEDCKTTLKRESRKYSPKYIRRTNLPSIFDKLIPNNLLYKASKISRLNLDYLGRRVFPPNMDLDRWSHDFDNYSFSNRYLNPHRTLISNSLINGDEYEYY